MVRGPEDLYTQLNVHGNQLLILDDVHPEIWQTLYSQPNLKVMGGDAHRKEWFLPKTCLGELP